MSEPILLDLYCSAGGAARGYQRAGFRVVGVDIVPQPRYAGDDFIQADAVELLAAYGRQFNAIHASPPCQRFSKLTAYHGKPEDHPDLVAKTRDVLRYIGRPYIIENVEGAPLIEPVTLCGSMFGLKVRRHRLFESNVALMTPPCDHKTQGRVIGVYGHPGGRSTRDGDSLFGSTAVWREAMGIDWMVGRELAEAIPPAYTEFLGRQLMEALS